MITITGQNFGTDKLDVAIRFGERIIYPISVTETSIVIQTPPKEEKEVV